MMTPTVAEPPLDSQTSLSSLSHSVAGTTEDNDSIVIMNPDRHCRTVSCDSGSKSTGRETAGDEPNSLVTSSVSLIPKKIRQPKGNVKASIWNYFEVYTAKEFKDLAVCMICNAKVYYSDSMSTTVLQRHLSGKHRSIFNTLIEDDVKKKLKTKADSIAV
jgi:hypothetical protein